MVGLLALSACGGPDARLSAQSACEEMHAVNLKLNRGDHDLQSFVQEAQFNATQALVADEQHFQHLAVLVNGFPKRVDARNENGAQSSMKQIIAECRALGLTLQQ